MDSALTTRILRGCVVCAVAALGLSLTAAHAQPYYDQYPEAHYPNTYAYAPGVTVRAHPYRQERAPNGAPIDNVQVTRVVDVSDLDLGTGYGRHIMRERVRRAAVDSCHDLDMLPGFVPAAGESDVDCYHRAVREALARAPVAVNADYNGY